MEPEKEDPKVWISKKTYENLQELVKIQGRLGNWNYDQYMRGMYNGMELMLATLDSRDPQFKGVPESYISGDPTTMSKREVSDLLTAWLVDKRSAQMVGKGSWNMTNYLLDCVRDAAATGHLPWESSSEWDAEHTMSKREVLDQLNSDSKLLDLMGTDGRKWVRAFVGMFGGDEGLMTTWFANAIEAGRSANQETASDCPDDCTRHETCRTSPKDSDGN